MEGNEGRWRGGEAAREEETPPPARGRGGDGGCCGAALGSDTHGGARDASFSRASGGWGQGVVALAIARPVQGQCQVNARSMQDH